MGYTDNTGLQHESYSAACTYYGIETPEQLAAEDRWQAEEDAIWHQDVMEARGGPVPAPCYDDEDLPF